MFYEQKDDSEDSLAKDVWMAKAGIEFAKKGANREELENFLFSIGASRGLAIAMAKEIAKRYLPEEPVGKPTWWGLVASLPVPALVFFLSITIFDLGSAPVWGRAVCSLLITALMALLFLLTWFIVSDLFNK